MPHMRNAPPFATKTFTVTATRREGTDAPHSLEDSVWRGHRALEVVERLGKIEED